MDGPDIFYYPNGKQKAVGNNKEGIPDGEWLGYYPNGKLSGKATYANGKQVSASFFYEDGSPNKEVKVFLRESTYPGGIAQYSRFLNKTLKYPDIAVQKNIKGTVVIGFKISKEGIPSEFKVVQSVDRSLDAEALRVLKMMPEWEPAIVGGIPSDDYKRQPVVFQF